MSFPLYPGWVARPRWQRAWCWFAYHTFMLLPLARGNGLYARFSLWLLSWAGCYANREDIHA